MNSDELQGAGIVILLERMPGCIAPVKGEKVKGIPLPAYKSAEAAGFDMSSNMHDAVSVSNSNVTMVRTGFKIEIPPGYYGQLQGRGGLGSNGVVVLGGVIDSDYRGEVIAMLTLSKPGSVTIKRAARMVQMVIHKLPVVTLMESPVSDNTERGEKGFSSTGE